MGTLLGPDGQPFDPRLALPPDEEAQMQQLAAMIKEPGMAKLSGMMLLIWRLYFLARTEITRIYGRRLTQEQLQAILMAVTERAGQEPFDLKDLKKQVKHVLLPWLRTIDPKNYQFREDSNVAAAQKPNAGRTEKVPGTGEPAGPSPADGVVPTAENGGQAVDPTPGESPGNGNGTDSKTDTGV